MKRFVIGDIHGANKALLQCLDKSAFNHDNDLLISIGDVCDGWPETKACFSTLLSIKNFVLILGNHDSWTLEWISGAKPDERWLQSGGKNTIESYQDGIPQDHIHLLENAKNYYILDNKLFVHAGIDPTISINEQKVSTLLFDRTFFKMALEKSMYQDSTHLTTFDEVYIGHTPIHRLGHSTPIKCAEVWMTDTGAAWGEKLSMIDIDTKEVFQSERTEALYPKGTGRVQ